MDKKDEEAKEIKVNVHQDYCLNSLTSLLLNSLNAAPDGHVI
mgnify:CR=1 FL=1